MPFEVENQETDVIEETNDVDTIDDIDVSLLEEFGIEVDEDKETDEADEGKETDAESTNENESDEDNSQTEGEEDQAQDDIPQFENESQNQAFAQMRIAEREARRQAEQYEEIIKALAQGTGYEDQQAFIDDVLNYQKQQYMEKEGHTEETLAMQQQLMLREQELQAREQAIQEQLFYEEASKFASYVEEQADTYGLKPEDIYQRLEESGFATPEEVINASNNHLLVQGVLVDEIAKYKAQEAINTENRRPEVNSDPLYSNNNQPNTEESSLDALMKASLSDSLVGL